MEEQTIGTARIDIVGNTSTLAVSVADAKRQISGLGVEASKQFESANQSVKRTAESLVNQINLAGKNRLEQIAYNAQLKIGGQLGQEIAAAALKQNEALSQATGGAKALAASINSFSDAKLLQVNQALSAYKKNLAEAAAASTAAGGETDVQQAARLSAMVKSSAAEQIAANTTVIASNEEVSASAAARLEAQAAMDAASVAALNAATQAKAAAYLRLETAMRGNLASAAGIAEAEIALDQAMAVGAITVNEQAAYFAKLAAAESAATVATEANTVATVENAAAFKLTSRATTELGVVFGELASGNTGRLKYSMAALANQTGLLAKLMSPTGLAVVGLAAALAVFVKAVYAGEQEIDAYNKALISTGNYAGATSGQLADLAKSMGGVSSTTHEAAAALAAVASSGKFAGDQVSVVGQGVLDAQQVTGKAIDAIVADFEKLAGDPVKASLALNDAQHYLTLSTYEQIKALEDQGHAQAAATLAEQTYASALHDRATSVEG